MVGWNSRTLSFQLSQQILCALTSSICKGVKLKRKQSGPSSSPIGREFFTVTLSFVHNTGSLQYEQSVHYENRKMNDLQDTEDINIMPFLTDRWNEAKKDEVQSHRPHSQWQKHASKVLSLSCCQLSIHLPHPAPLLLVLASTVTNLALLRRHLFKDKRLGASSEDVPFYKSQFKTERNCYEPRKKMKHD